jgi:hypothetical protein
LLPPAPAVEPPLEAERTPPFEAEEVPLLEAEETPPLGVEEAPPLDVPAELRTEVLPPLESQGALGLGAGR